MLRYRAVLAVAALLGCLALGYWISGVFTERAELRTQNKALIESKQKADATLAQAVRNAREARTEADTARSALSDVYKNDPPSAAWGASSIPERVLRTLE